MAFDLRNFIIHTGYPIDKVVKMMNGTITLPANSVGTGGTAYAHGLPFTPLDITIFSNSSTFNTSIDSGFPLYGKPNGWGIIAETNGTNIYIRPWNNTGTARTVYWRSVMLEPSDSKADVPYTAINADVLQFSTKYNYSKLVKDGIATGSASVSHGLGYFPQVLIWADSPAGFRYRLTNNAFTNPSATVSTADVQLNNTNANSVRMHYRIYGDD